MKLSKSTFLWDLDVIFTPNFHCKAQALNQVSFLNIYPAIKNQLTIDADALAAAATQPISAPGNTPDHPLGLWFSTSCVSSFYTFCSIPFFADLFQASLGPLIVATVDQSQFPARLATFKHLQTELVKRLFNLVLYLQDYLNKTKQYWTWVSI